MFEVKLNPDAGLARWAEPGASSARAGWRGRSQSSDECNRESTHLSIVRVASHGPARRRLARHGLRLHVDPGGAHRVDSLAVRTRVDLKQTERSWMCSSELVLELRKAEGECGDGLSHHNSTNDEADCKPCTHLGATRGSSIAQEGAHHTVGGSTIQQGTLFYRRGGAL